MVEHDAEAWVSAGDWQVLYRRYFSRIARYCARSGGDSADAEDLAQQVFVQLARTKIPEKPLPYLQAIARNVLAQYRRRRATEQAALAGYLGYKQIAAEGSQGQEVTGRPAARGLQGERQRDSDGGRAQVAAEGCGTRDAAIP
ncbi:MAG: sigma-70 family RNA polymerase sigma factor [Phycisphaerae bacterium]|nr:sigma-70 family RNA polymerase sigma factor [Phycisphaerae bacterium]